MPPSIATNTEVGLKQAAWVTGAFVVVLWAMEVLDTVSGHALDAYGVQPRSEEGLIGIAAAPLLHFGFDHLISNTVPVAVLGFLTLATGIARGLLATAIIWVVGGLGVWVFAQPGSNHAGASVLIFGWIVYLVVRGILNRRSTEILIGVAVFLLYSGALLGVLPGPAGCLVAGPPLRRDRRVRRGPAADDPQPGRPRPLNAAG